jgi:hypothetical protein
VLARTAAVRSESRNEERKDDCPHRACAASEGRKVIVRQYCILLTAALSLLNVFHCGAQGSAFTYQGRLDANGSPASGIYDLRFLLFNVPTAGASIAGPVTNAGVAIAGGLFSVSIDFGPGVLDGPPRWLQIGVRTNGNPAGFVALAPRQLLTPAPYAI